MEKASMETHSIKEHPILYSSVMIQAKLAGRKTQTRRIMKVQPEQDCYFEIKVLKDVVGPAVCLIDYNQGDKNPYVRCPYGNVGDILWARETWCSVSRADCAGGVTTKYHYKADYEDTYKWKPSIHMPKSAARIWERITDIRVERLQDISEGDAMAEGIEYNDHVLTGGELRTMFKNYKNPDTGYMYNAVSSYATLWQYINGDGSWELNPWVWVITTEILSTTGRPAGLAVSKTETK